MSMQLEQMFLGKVKGAEDLQERGQRLPLSLTSNLVAQMVKNLPAVWETWVRCLGQEDPLQKGMATHCSILVWRLD